MQKTALKFIWHYFRQFKYTLVLIVVLAAAGQLCGQGAVYLFASLFDYAAANRPSPVYWQHLLIIILFCIGIDLLAAVLRTLSMWFGNRLVPHIRSIVIKEVFAYVNKHSISYFTNEMTGNISNKFNQLQSGMVDFYMHCGNMMFDACFLLVNLVILSWMD